jgi:asparagine synthase (glutamine-hydrolysing)
MWTADGTIGVIFNGEIYNHLTCAPSHEAGHVFRTDHPTPRPCCTRIASGAGFRHPHERDVVVHPLRQAAAVVSSRDRFARSPSATRSRTAPSSSLEPRRCATTRHAHARVRRGLRSTGYGYIPAPTTILRACSACPRPRHVDLRTAS